MTRHTPFRSRHRAPLGPRLLAVGLLTALLGAACGTDDGATVTTIGATEASGSTASSGSSSGSGTGTGEIACSPVNPELEADAAETVVITAVDYAFQPEDVAVDAGVVTFTLDNEGAANHELAFLPGGGDVPLNAEGEPDEDALGEAGAFELEAFSPGQSCNATYDIEPGTYTLFCIIETDEGETHYELGMRGTLTVS